MRYLKYFDFKLVKEALKERDVLLKIMPHICWPMRFLIPLESFRINNFFIRCGLFIYDYIAGYTIINDISEREFQLEREGQWSKGKSHDTFSPIGPYLVTKDEVDNEDSLSMTLSVDGKIFQNGNTNTMFFKVPFIISYLSNFMTLLPGDIVSTGTPPGVGFGQKPEVYLKEGQTMKLTIEKLGTQRQVTVSL